MTTMDTNTTKPAPPPPLRSQLDLHLPRRAQRRRSRSPPQPAHLPCPGNCLCCARAVGCSQRWYGPLWPPHRLPLSPSPSPALCSLTPTRGRRSTASNCITSRKSSPFSKNSSLTLMFTREMKEGISICCNRRPQLIARPRD